MGRHSSQNGLPRYVSRHARTGLYQYYRRPPTGVRGAAFVRSFGTRDLKRVFEMYAMVHQEAEMYFAQLASGRATSDFDLKFVALGLVLNDDPGMRKFDGRIKTASEFRDLLIQHEGERARSLSDADMSVNAGVKMHRLAGVKVHHG